MTSAAQAESVNLLKISALYGNQKPETQDTQTKTMAISIIMGILYPHGCFCVGTWMSVVTVLRQAQRWHICAKEATHTVSPLLGHLSMIPSPSNTTHTPQQPLTQSHTHSVSGCLSANLEFYTLDCSNSEQEGKCALWNISHRHCQLAPHWTASTRILTREDAKSF